MHWNRESRRVKAMAAAFVALGLAVASPASAKQFNMTGSWTIRNGQTFIPLQFALTAVTMGMTFHVTGTNAAGGPLKGINFPNGPVIGNGVVDANANTIMVPQDIFISSPPTVLPLSRPNIQITTMFGVDAPYAAATLMKGGGPGAFTWCPQNPLCTKGQKLSVITGVNGRGRARIIYNGGGNQFGGTIQIGLKNGGLVSSVFGTGAPLRVQHAIFGGGAGTRKLAPGGGMADAPAMELVYLQAAYVTQPLATPAPLITSPGGFVTTMGGVTTLGGMGPKLVVAGGMTTMGAPWLEMTTNYGFPHTTRTVIGQQTAAPYPPGDDFFTLMGYDKRGPNGAGNIATVAGGISFRNAPTAGVNNRPYVSIHRIWYKLQSPVPAMSPAGFATAAALMVLGVGYALRRRLA
jgi:hypothetical protein